MSVERARGEGLSDLQPIATAPKDGTRILLAWCPDTHRFPNLPSIMDIRLGRWSASYRYGYQEGWVDRNYYRIECCTHWAPILEPPKIPTRRRQHDMPSMQDTLDNRNQT